MMTAKNSRKPANKSEPNFKIGDCVRWDSSGGTSEGKIIKIATTSGRIKNFMYKAAKDDPRYIVETDEGKQAAHKASELRSS